MIYPPWSLSWGIVKNSTNPQQKKQRSSPKVNKLFKQLATVQLPMSPDTDFHHVLEEIDRRASEGLEMQPSFDPTDVLLRRS